MDLPLATLSSELGMLKSITISSTNSARLQYGSAIVILSFRGYSEAPSAERAAAGLFCPELVMGDKPLTLFLWPAYVNKS